jgi:hypothetical protein
MVQMRSTAQVTVDAGFPIKVRLPLATIKNAGLNIGDKLYVCFKADSLHVFAEDTIG